jgi:hypothetical protein
VGYESAGGPLWIAHFSVHSAWRCETAARVALHATPRVAECVVIDRLSTSARVLALNLHISTPPSPRPVRLRCFREALRRQNGMRRPAGLLNASNPPGGVRQHRPSATTSGTCECSNAKPKGTMPPVEPRRVGSPINRRDGAPKGGRPRRADCVSGLRGTQGATFRACGPAIMARERVPLHPSACRRSVPHFW